MNRRLMGITLMTLAPACVVSEEGAKAELSAKEIMDRSAEAACPKQAAATLRTLEIRTLQAQNDREAALGKKPGGLPGPPELLQIKGKEAWLAGTVPGGPGSWVGAYALADGKARAETRLKSVDVGWLKTESDSTPAFQIGSREVVVCKYMRTGPWEVSIFDLKNGKPKWSLERLEKDDSVLLGARLLPAGLLIQVHHQSEDMSVTEQSLRLYRLGGDWE